MSEFVERYIAQTALILDALDQAEITRVVGELAALKARGGRLFVIGSGGGAGHASHAVNDFRKIAGIEAYAPTDNVSELTARINDDGWETAYANWLRASRFRSDDGLFVFSVGGGDPCRGVSVNLVRCIELARKIGARVFGVVGRDGGFTRQAADACVVIPVIDPALVTPHTEGLQAVVWHLLVSHPALESHQAKWESLAGARAASTRAEGWSDAPYFPTATEAFSAPMPARNAVHDRNS